MFAGAYQLSVAVHILAAMLWLGGMLFLVCVLMPAMKGLDDPALRSRLLRSVGLRFRTVGWICLVVLLVSGYTNLASRGLGGAALLDPGFWSTFYGATLAFKFGVFTLILMLSAIHDFLLGPKAGAAMRAAPHDPAALRLRSWAIWFGRVNLILAVVMVLSGIVLVRGWPW